MPSYSRIASAALLTFATLTHANHDDEVWSAFEILNTFDPHNVEPFCAEFIGYKQPTETCWVTDAPITVTKTTACGKSTPGYVASTPGYTAVTPGYAAGTPGYAAGTPGYAAVTPAPNSPDYAANPGIVTVLTTTTITYTTTSTIYVPAATAYPTHYKLARDTFCPDYDVPCRLVQYDFSVIAAACEKYLDQSSAAATITSHVQAATATVTAKECRNPGYGVKPADGGYTPKPADGGYTANPAPAPVPAPSYPTNDDDSSVGDGEDLPSDFYGTPFEGDGEDVPEGAYEDPYDGEDAPEGSYDGAVGDGEDEYAGDGGDEEGDGEDLPDEYYVDGSGEEEQDDGTEYSPYDK